MASIKSGTPLKDGSPTWRVMYSFNLGSRRIQKSESFNRHADAKRRKNEIEMTVERKGIGDPFRMTLGNYLDRWLNGRILDERNSPTTLAAYRNNIVIAKKFLAGVPLAKLTPDHLREAYRDMRVSGGRTPGGLKPGAERKEMPLAKQTVLSVHAMLSAALQDACPPRSKLIAENPARGVAPPRPDKTEVDQLTEEQTAAMWRAAQAKQEEGRIYNGIDLIFLLLVTSGIRRSELLGLCWDCIDVDRSEITIRRTVVRGLDGQPILRERGKTRKSTRSLRVDAAVVELLKRHLIVIRGQRGKWDAGLPDLVFPESHGGVMMPTRLTARLYQLQKAAGVKYASVVHALRHTHISVLLNAGAPLKVVSVRAGHARVGITADIYGHVTEAADQAASDTFTEHLQRVISTAKNATKMQPQIRKIGESGE
jgi:integrase